MAARVDSIDALRELRAALWKFGEAATQILSDVEAHMQRMLVWLETEQLQYWQGQIRSRGEAVTRAKEAVRAKRLFKIDEGARPSDVEEQKALRLAQTRLEEANTKLANTRRYMLKLQKEILLYKGQVQRLSRYVGTELPMAAGRLDSMAATLDAYVTLAPEAAGVAEGVSATEPGAAEALPSFKRPEPVETPQPKMDTAETPSQQGRQSPSSNREEQSRHPSDDGRDSEIGTVSGQEDADGRV